MTAVWNANAGMKEIDSAVRHSEFAATLTVPSEAIVRLVMMPAEDMKMRSSIAGRLMRKICFVKTQSIFQFPRSGMR